MNRYIIVAGNPCDGFAFHGPFYNDDAADEWAARTLSNCGSDYWIGVLSGTEAEKAGSVVDDLDPEAWMNRVTSDPAMMLEIAQRVRAELIDTREKLFVANHELNHATAERDALRTDLRIARNTNASAQREIDRLNSQYDKLESELKLARASHDRAVDRATRMTAERDALLDQQASLEDTIRALDTQVASGARYVIPMLSSKLVHDDDEMLYWSNQIGWTSLSHATVYTEEEKDKFGIPFGGDDWVKLPVVCPTPETLSPATSFIVNDDIRKVALDEKHVYMMRLLCERLHKTDEGTLLRMILSEIGAL